MKKFAFLIGAFFTIAFPINFLEAGGNWNDYHSEQYGFSMHVPQGAEFIERERKGGWGGLYSRFDGVEIYGLVKLGIHETPNAIQRFGVKELGIPASQWNQVDEGENSNGWIWFQSFEAKKGNSICFAGIGTGPKGSYLIFLRTSLKDFENYKKDYMEWYESIRLK